MAKDGHNATAIVNAKYSAGVEKENCLKDAKNVSPNTLKLFYAKNGSKKLVLFEKREHFENGQKKLFYARNGSKKQLALKN